MKCGKQDGTDKSDVCPIAAEKSANGLNGGKNGGRLCWIIADAHPATWRSCSIKGRKDPCFSCEFRFKVMMEEGMINVCKATGSFLQIVKNRG